MCITSGKLLTTCSLIKATACDIGGYWGILGGINCTLEAVIIQVKRLVSENNKIIIFLLLCYLIRRAKMPPSKFEANSMLCLRVKLTSVFFISINVFVLEQLFLRIHDN